MTPSATGNRQLVTGHWSLVTAMRHFIKYWLPVLIWSAAILLAASDAFSSRNSGHFLGALLDWLSREQLAIVNFVLRKLTHVIVYAILGALAFRAVRGGRAGWQRAWWLAAIAIACAVAAADESMQNSTALRNGSPWDVLLDVTAAAIVTTLPKRSRV